MFIDEFEAEKTIMRELTTYQYDLEDRFGPFLHAMENGPVNPRDLVDYWDALGKSAASVFVAALYVSKQAKDGSKLQNWSDEKVMQILVGIFAGDDRDLKAVYGRALLSWTSKFLSQKRPDLLEDLRATLKSFTCLNDHKISGASFSHLMEGLNGPG